MTDDEINRELRQDIRRSSRPLLLLLILSALCLVLLWVRTADAQALSGTFASSPASGNAPLSTTLSWDTVNSAGDTTCVASGSWVGAKVLSGTQTITGLTASATYTLTCTTPGKAARPAVPALAMLKWTPPTKNTDGSALTDLAGYRIYYGTSASALTQTVEVANASISTYEPEIFGSGTYYFAVRAVNAAGNESVNSNVASKLMDYTPAVAAVPPVVWTKTITVQVVPQPNPPAALTAAVGATAYGIKPDYITFGPMLVSSKLGTVRVKTTCKAIQRISGTDLYRVPKSAVAFSGKASDYVVAPCANI